MKKKNLRMPEKKESAIDDSYISFDFEKFLTPIAIFISGLMISVSILYSLRNINSVSSPSTPTDQTTDNTEQEVTVTLDQVKSLYNDKNITFGDANRKVLFVEISDPSCPYCQIAAGKNPELNKEFGGDFVLVADGGSYVAPVEEMKKLVNEGKASYVWLYQNGHSNGELAAKALYCAYEKGKFWEVHDLLMSSKGYNLINNEVKNDKAKSSVLADFTKSVMSQNDMKNCLESGKYDQKIPEDAQLATSLGVKPTPGFFVNTTYFRGAYSYVTMEPYITEALK